MADSEDTPRISKVRKNSSRWRCSQLAKGDFPKDYDIADAGYLSPCWLWTGAISIGGYATYKGEKVHRLVLQQAGVMIPPDKEPDHLCKIKRCIRLDHLEIVSHTENVRRGKHTKLSIDDARRIKLRLSAGETLLAIANDYGCTESNICAIRRGKTWRDV